MGAVNGFKWGIVCNLMLQGCLKWFIGKIQGRNIDIQYIRVEVMKVQRGHKKNYTEEIVDRKV